MAVDQVKLGDLKRKRAAFLAFGMKAAASGCDSEIARLTGAAEVEASEPDADTAVEAPVVETAVDAAAVRRRPPRRRY